MENFRPSTGTIEIFEPPMGPGVRLGTRRRRRIGGHSPLRSDALAKLIVWAPSRASAIGRMKRALSDFVVLGVRHNIDFLHRIVSSDDFAAGRLDTGFLSTHPELLSGSSEIPREVRLFAALKAPGAHDAPQTIKDPWTSGPWRNS